MDGYLQKPPVCPTPKCFQEIWDGKTVCHICEAKAKIAKIFKSPKESSE